MWLSLVFAVSCSGVELAKESANRLKELNDEAAAEREQTRPEREQEVEAFLAKHERKLVKPEEIKRARFQEWLDHQQSAWVPVAVVSDLVVSWPKAARITQFTVSQREVAIQATTLATSQALKDVLDRSPWVEDVAISDTVVTGQVARVKRSLASESDAEVGAEVQRLTDTHALGSSPVVSDRNFETAHANELDAFNCWRRVIVEKERFQRMDGSWSEGGTAEARPKQPTVSMGQWVDQSKTESGKTWTRHRASVDLRGPFPALVQGLDCVQSTGARYSVRTIDFIPDPMAAGDTVLQLGVDLIIESAWAEEREAPWSEANVWGETEPPERTRTLKDRVLVNPFAE